MFSIFNLSSLFETLMVFDNFTFLIVFSRNRQYFQK